MSSTLLRPGGPWAVRFSRGILALLCISGSLAETGCKTRPREGGVRIARKATTTTPSPETTAPAPVDPDAPDMRYQTVVRPMLSKHGCTSGQCHGAFKGGGLFLTSGMPNDKRDYKTILKRLDRNNPEKSELVLKATNKLQHNGGLNIREDSCDYKRMVAWIGNRPDVECNDDTPPDPERFAREIMPTFRSLGCAAGSCHATPGKAREKFDLSQLVATPPNPAVVRMQVGFTHPNDYTVWQSKLVTVALGQDGIHKAIDPLSCGFRRLYGYLAGAPEQHCALPDDPAASREPKLPDLEAFTQVVLPTIAKRGCTGVGCHGGGAGGMVLMAQSTTAPTALHDYLMLIARVEDLNKPEDSTLIRTVRNLEPHGGGRRFGGAGDCVDELMVKWLQRQPIVACPPPTPPSYARFVSEIQGVLDKMTCTNLKCHGGSIPQWVLLPFPKDDQTLRKNYEAVRHQIDPDFMPLSGIQLRMREPCAYAKVGSWIENRPSPTCVVHDPDPSIFPRRDADGNIQHPKMDAPPPAAPLPAPQKT